MVDVAPAKPGAVIRQPSIPQQIVVEITRRIENGTYAIGSLLVERDLMTEFAVGRSSVRTALQALQQARLIIVNRGKGWKILGAPPDVGVSVGHLTDVASARWIDGERRDPRLSLLEVRMSLETSAVKTAAHRATPQEIDWIQELSDHYARADSAEINELMDADEAFHTALIAGAHNPALDLIYESLQRGIRDFRRGSYDDHGVVHKRAQDQHQQIVTAISQRQPALAEQLMLAHIWTLYEEVREQDPDADDEPIAIFG